MSSSSNFWFIFEWIELVRMLSFSAFMDYKKISIQLFSYLTSKLILGLTMVLLCMSTCSPIPPGIPGKQIPLKYQVSENDPQATPYLLYLPKDYDDDNRQWPLLVFLHGRGERGSDINLVKTHGPPKLIEQGISFPFLVISPQCPLIFPEWDWQLLDNLLTEVLKTYRIDCNRIYLTGLSMGGFGSWTWAMNRPERFAALVPICGWGDTSKVCSLKNIPIWTFHGAQDPVIPIQKTEDLVRALKECGGNVNFTIYPEAKHDAWTETYDNQELYRWILMQKNSVDE